MSETPEPCQNTDRELWRERPDDYYADSIHVTERGVIGINCGGLVFVKPVREWHELARKQFEATEGYDPRYPLNRTPGGHCDICGAPDGEAHLVPHQPSAQPWP